MVIANDFYLGTFVVTDEHWAAVWYEIDVGGWYPPYGLFGPAPSPSRSFLRDPQPDPASVTEKSWCAAMAFCDWLTNNGETSFVNDRPGGD